MDTITDSDLDRLEFTLVKYQGSNEIWAFDNQRIVRDPKTEEIIDYYFVKEEKKQQKTL